jgi:hypothetical protein
MTAPYGDVNVAPGLANKSYACGYWGFKAESVMVARQSAPRRMPFGWRMLSWVVMSDETTVQCGTPERSFT